MNYLLGLDAEAWQAVFGGLVTLFSLVNMAFAGFMWRMRATFATRTDVEAGMGAVRKENTESFAAVRRENDTRFESMERTIAAFDARMRVVESNAAGAAAETRGVRDVVNRIDHMTMLLFEHRLRESESG